MSYVLYTLIAILRTDYHLCFVFSIKKSIKSIQNVLPSGLASLRGRLVRTIANDRIFNLTVHFTLSSLINNNFNMYTVQYVKRFLSKK